MEMATDYFTFVCVTSPTSESVELDFTDEDLERAIAEMEPAPGGMAYEPPCQADPGETLKLFSSHHSTPHHSTPQHNTTRHNTTPSSTAALTLFKKGTCKTSE
jgi:hypothetical protein